MENHDGRCGDAAGLGGPVGDRSPSVSALSRAIPNAEEWGERIDMAIANGTTPASDGAHNYVRNGMLCLLADLAVPIGLLRVRQAASKERHQGASDVIHALIAKSIGHEPPLALDPVAASILASAIEARRAETVQQGSVHESAVAESETPRND